MIADIAEQTNILALNASIEAARADGDSEGFAVVADEVKQLAEETKAATEEIDELVGTVQSRTQATVDDIRETSERERAEGVATVEETVGALERIVDRVERTNEGVQEINRSTDAQAEAAGEATTMVEDVAATSQQTAADSEAAAETTEAQAAAVREVFDLIDGLSERADTLSETLRETEVDGDAGRRDGAVGALVSGGD
jgi:methyl-accepting chemotaxis protein